VLALLVGKPNVAAPSLMSLGKDFGKQNLVGKSVATIADVRLGLNTESFTNRKEEIDASINLYRLLKAIMELNLAEKQIA